MTRTPLTVITDNLLIVREPSAREAAEFTLPPGYLIIINSANGRMIGQVKAADLFDADGNRFGDAPPVSTKTCDHPVETEKTGFGRWAYTVPSLGLIGRGYGTEDAAFAAGRRAVGRQLALLRGDKQ